MTSVGRASMHIEAMFSRLSVAVLKRAQSCWMSWSLLKREHDQGKRLAPEKWWKVECKLPIAVAWKVKRACFTAKTSRLKQSTSIPHTYCNCKALIVHYNSCINTCFSTGLQFTNSWGNECNIFPCYIFCSRYVNSHKHVQYVMACITCIMREHLKRS